MLNFDNIGNAMLTLFVVSTLDDYMAVRNQRTQHSTTTRSFDIKGVGGLWLLADSVIDAEECYSQFSTLPA